ncbi:hypothetical protein GJAV_G00103910 [Gymnothorax javanicus]|nr:hypothetical protein GJAV_G00103910 [Gymnothorax javanicus]
MRWVVLLERLVPLPEKIMVASTLKDTCQSVCPHLHTERRPPHHPEGSFPVPSGPCSNTSGHVSWQPQVCTAVILCACGSLDLTLPFLVCTTD